MAEKEYIDRQAFIKRLENEADRSTGILDLMILNGLANIVRDKGIAPDADVTEIKHGEWGKPLRTDDGWVRKCSRCLYSSSIGGSSNNKPDFCSNCGAKMDGKGVPKNE